MDMSRPGLEAGGFSNEILSTPDTLALGLPIDSRLPTEGLHLPLVSVVIPNYNYAGFLSEAISSVMRQTYPSVECVVVDDFSTDDSVSTIRNLQKEYPTLKAIFRSENGGHIRAAEDGLRGTTGEFVHFLDPDDFIDPEFLAAHIALHLGLRRAVAFTCCNSYQLHGQGILAGSSDAFGRLIGSSRLPFADFGAGADGLLAGIYSGYEMLAPNAYLVETDEPGWPWSFISATVFRRRAVELFSDIDCGSLKSGLDGVLCRGANAIGCSVLLDLPLVYYRHHEHNTFSKATPLANTVTFDHATNLVDERLIVTSLLSHIDANAERFGRLFMGRTDLTDLKRRLARLYPGSWRVDPLVERARSHHLSPLVTFIVVNYNYGRYLTECIDSIMGQTYSNIECLIIDNGSTDDSLDVIAALEERYPDLVAIRAGENLGQNAACQRGYSQSHGDYIVFVDADDYYAPDFALEHICTHLTNQIAVGFTSCEMMQRVDCAIVLGSFFSASPQTFQCPESDARRSERLALMQKMIDDRAFADPRTVAEVFYVQKTCIDWVWSATSSNMYRRDAVELFIHNERLATMRLGTDAYLNFGINSICGSALIKKPLGVYRVHGDNNFSEGAALEGIVRFKKDHEPASVAALSALTHILHDLEGFWRKSGNLTELAGAMRTLLRRASRRPFPAFEKIILGMLRIYFSRMVRQEARRLNRNVDLRAYLTVDRSGGSAHRR